MKKYAKIVNEETKQCDVGLGSDKVFYESIGMVELDVEQSCNGVWFTKGYVPSSDFEDFTRECKLSELKQNLANTDYKAIQFAEGVITFQDYEPMKIQREEWREEIRKLTDKE